VIEPIRGLDSDIIVELARTLMAKLFLPLATEKRSIPQDVPPPEIYAVGHDVDHRALKKDDHMTVLLLGSAKKKASFSIGNVIEHIPMVEQGHGRYVGEFYPLSTDSFADEPVVVSLTDD